MSYLAIFATFKPRIWFIMISLVAHHLNTSFSFAWCISKEYFETTAAQPKKVTAQIWKAKKTHNWMTHNAAFIRLFPFWIVSFCGRYMFASPFATTISYHNARLLEIFLSLSIARSIAKMHFLLFDFGHQKSVLVAAELWNGIRRIEQVHTKMWTALKKKKKNEECRSV